MCVAFGSDKTASMTIPPDKVDKKLNLRDIWKNEAQD